MSVQLILDWLDAAIDQAEAELAREREHLGNSAGVGDVLVVEPAAVPCSGHG